MEGWVAERWDIQNPHIYTHTHTHTPTLIPTHQHTHIYTTIDGGKRILFTSSFDTFSHTISDHPIYVGT